MAERLSSKNADKQTDKKTALETAIQQIEKQYGKGSVMRLGQTQSLNVDSISTGSIGLDAATGIGGLPKGRIIEIYGPESRVKQRLRSMSLPKLRKRAARLRSLTLNTRSTRNMRRRSALMLIRSLFHSPTTANRRLKLPNILPVPVLSMLLLSTRSRRSFPVPRSKAKWAILMSAHTQGSCRRRCASSQALSPVRTVLSFS